MVKQNCAAPKKPSIFLLYNFSGTKKADFVKVGFAWFNIKSCQ
ncbi:hypothetical protein [Acinetobacter phage Ab105-2phideltaCI404ad]|nr:hypothetical protein [Acinetobacter phage Ab105-2phideltaCI404ad]